MGTVSTSLPSDGTTIDASDVNTPINAILSEFNGNIDDNNIKTAANINGSKILAASLSGSKLDTTTAGGWIASGLPAVSSVTENGNRSADITFASTVASILTPGMRIRTSRTVAAPTGAILLNGTTQYASKTTPSNITFTDDFVCSAWIRLTSYAQGGIITRWNGTSGFIFTVEADGRLLLRGYNAGAANFSEVKSYQSVPLNKWVHVAAQLDMSTFTATTTTSYTMIDGVDVPAAVTRGGTNPTALVQAGNLEIGSFNGGTGLFNGNIAQVALYSAKVTQATIRASKNQTLSGSETSLNFAAKLDQASGLNDLTANANNLTATGSPTYSVASPFTTDANGTPGGTYDYAIVTKVATTVATVQYPEGCAIPTSGGISTVDYSGVKSPFGMPTQRSRWRVEVLGRTTVAQTAPVSGTFYNIGSMQITVPVGDWQYGYNVNALEDRAAGILDMTVTLSTSASSDTSNKTMTANANVSAGSTQQNMSMNVSDFTSLSTATLHYLIAKTDVAGVSNIYFANGNNKGLIYAEPTYL